MSKKTLFTVLMSIFLTAATQSMWGQATGKIVVNFSIAVDASISSTANIACQASAEVSDGPASAKNLIHETATVLATRSGSTATCTVNIPYSWNLVTATTDKVVLGYQITAPVEVPTGSVTSTLPARVSEQPRYAAIPVPISGSTTTEDLTVTF
jgi:hypothetical protein